MPKFLWKLMTIGPKRLYRAGLGWLIGGRILLLTTTGRKTGVARSTPLQYEAIEGGYVIGSARGMQADWVKNILQNPSVTVEVGRDIFQAIAQVVSEPEQVADFLEMRYRNHPRFMKVLLWLQGYREKLDHTLFMRYAQERVMVELKPVNEPLQSEAV